MENGTRISPPAEAPPAVRPTTVARFRWNHLASTAPVLVIEAPLAAVEVTRPNMKTRNRIWKVRLSRMVDTPTTTRLINIALLPPVRSTSLPRKG